MFKTQKGYFDIKKTAFFITVFLFFKEKLIEN